MTQTVPAKDARKGRAFTGFRGGKRYVAWAKLFGFTESFYEKALGNVVFDQDITAVDLGCGPGLLTLALAKRLTPGSTVHGIDLSADQIRYARSCAEGSQAPVHFSVGSADSLPFASESVGLIVTSMALHEMARDIRPRVIMEVARALKPGGCFILVDWSKPKFGFWAAVWLPFLIFGDNNKDNWNNAYRGFCRSNFLEVRQDTYITSVVRRQAYEKVVNKNNSY